MRSSVLAGWPAGLAKPRPRSPRSASRAPTGARAKYPTNPAPEAPSILRANQSHPLLHSARERPSRAHNHLVEPSPLARESTLQDRHRLAASAKRKQQTSSASVERVRSHVALRECQRPENRRAGSSRIGGRPTKPRFRVLQRPTNPDRDCERLKPATSAWSKRQSAITRRGREPVACPANLVSRRGAGRADPQHESAQGVCATCLRKRRGRPDSFRPPISWIGALAMPCLPILSRTPEPIRRDEAANRIGGLYRCITRHYPAIRHTLACVMGCAKWMLWAARCWSGLISPDSRAAERAPTCCRQPSVLSPRRGVSQRACDEPEPIYAACVRMVLMLVPETHYARAADLRIRRYQHSGARGRC